jgi:hypothetical protein
MKDYETKGYSMYGAQMGRRDRDTIFPGDKVRLYKVNLDSGGYDKGGAYWGHGTPLYCAENEDGAIMYFRAYNRETAKSKLLETFDKLRFYR